MANEPEEQEQEQPQPGGRKKSKQEEVEDKLASVKLRTAEVQLKQAQMQLEQTEEQIDQWKNEREQRSRRNMQRQSQLKIDINEKADKARGCTHRQGGSLRQPNRGKGASALNVVILPDERELIMCSICPLRVFSPYPGEGARRRRRGESQEQAEARVAKYHQDLAEFEHLKEHASDKLTEEAAAPMHCGKTFKYLDGDGNQVQVPAPCDTYAQGLDNRKGVRA